MKTSQPSHTASTISKVQALAKSRKPASQTKTEVCKQKPQPQYLPGSSKTKKRISQSSKIFLGRGLVCGSGDEPVDDYIEIEQNGVIKFKRPPYTYSALIASAILDSEHHLVTLKGIYGYITNNFPYYKYHHKEEQWKNSIRHNLSLNEFFISGS